jgi:hypothetical protein
MTIALAIFTFLFSFLRFGKEKIIRFGDANMKIKKIRRKR